MVVVALALALALALKVSESHITGLMGVNLGASGLVSYIFIEAMCVSEFSLKSLRRH